VDIVLLSPHEALRHGKDTFFVEFRNASGGTLVDVGPVQGNATMPMAGMPMLGSVDVKRTAVAGRYEATLDLSMAGTWRMTLRWNGPSGQNAVTFSTTIQ
jgi:YtkA-like